MKIYSKTVDAGLNSMQLHDAAYTFLREILREEWHLENSIIEKTAAGKPFLVGQDVHISISHTKGLVCCAVGETPVGIDCEHDRKVSEGVIRRVCTPREIEDIRAAEDPTAHFLMYWTLKESISKKRGVGLKESFLQYEIAFENDKPVCSGHKLYFEKRGGFFLAAAE